ncbi:hypothetical protein [Roseovarius atlanticus]|uniref:hypothetical protein n=1 Tax=Roseovarius atlanticus TaxID=1641875 RepID=UPI000A4C67C2|nr:hypothetical protein [Roseovarius atlanticus]
MSRSEEGTADMFWVILFMAAFVVPFWKLLPGYGIASPWALVAIFPLGALALLYLMAFGPRADDRG